MINRKNSCDVIDYFHNDIGKAQETKIVMHQ